MKKFRTNLDSIITEHEVVKETPARITYLKEWRNWKTNEPETKQVTENKISHWCSWHDSMDEAKEFLIDRLNKDIDWAYMNVKLNREKIERIKGL